MCPTRAVVICFFVCSVLTAQPQIYDDNLPGMDNREESGDGGVIEYAFNISRLDGMIMKAVDRKIAELRARFLSQANGISPRQPVPTKQTKNTEDISDRKNKYKSLEYRLFKLSTDLEGTKNALERQTALLDRSAMASDLHQRETQYVSSRQDRLEKSMSVLSSRLDKLTKIIGPINHKHYRRHIKRNKKVGNQETIGNTYPKDCDTVYTRMGQLFKKDYMIQIQPHKAQSSFMALCKVLNRTGWTVIQRRFNGSVDFYRTWNEYSKGFGSTDGEFWIGNNNIHHLTKTGQMSLRIEFEDWEGREYFAEYEKFRIDSEDELFRLHVSGYHGNSGDSLTSTWESHDGYAFSTHDRDNDGRFNDNCSEHFHGAWWFNSCFASHLNGKYLQKEIHKNFFKRNGIQWNTLHSYASLKSTTMMIAPKQSSKYT